MIDTFKIKSKSLKIACQILSFDRKISALINIYILNINKRISVLSNFSAQKRQQGQKAGH